MQPRAGQGATETKDSPAGCYTPAGYFFARPPRRFSGKRPVNPILAALQPPPSFCGPGVVHSSGVEDLTPQGTSAAMKDNRIGVRSPGYLALAGPGLSVPAPLAAI